MEVPDYPEMPAVQKCPPTFEKPFLQDGFCLPVLYYLFQNSNSVGFAEVTKVSADTKKFADLKKII